MGCFTQMTERRFRTTTDGTRLFSFGIYRVRRYIVPDVATETRLFQKSVWLSRLTVGTAMCGIPIMFLLAPDSGPRAVHFFTVGLMELAFTATCGWLLFRNDLRQSQICHGPVKLLPFSGDKRVPTSLLVVALLVCLLIMADVVVVITLKGRHPLVAYLVIGLFALCAIVCLYLLVKRLRSSQSIPVSQTR